MKKTKKLCSLLLSILILTSILSIGCINAYAENNYYTYELSFGKTQSGQLEWHDYSMYKFSIDSYKTLKLDFDAQNWGPKYLFIIKAKDFDDFKKGKDVTVYFRYWADTTNNNDYWCDQDISLYSGTYYFGIFIDNNYSGEFINYDFSLTPTVSKVKNLKSSTTTNSVKLSWTGDMGAVGYQVQKNTSNGYKLVKTTTNTSYTAKDLSTATSYKYRVRGYTKVDGKTYYGSWKTVTAVTKPSKVSIKTPTTNSKHQIIAKWNKVKRASGYQVQYCKNRNCSSVIATKAVSGQSKISYTGKNFTKNKTYYVRVRAYKTVNNTKYYGAWSSVKSIKCK